MPARLAPYLERFRTHGRFKVVSVAAMAAALALAGPWFERRMTNREIGQTGRTVAEYLETILGPELQEIAHQSSLSREQIEGLDAVVRKTTFGKTFAALKIRDRGGRILYSSAAPSMIGLAFPDDPKNIRAWHGEIAAGISNLKDPENAGERHLARELLEVYVPIHATRSDEIITVAEFFIRLDDMQGEIDNARRWSWATVGLFTLAVYLIVDKIFRSRADLMIEKQARELKSQVDVLTTVMRRNAELDRRISGAAATVVTLNERFLKRIGSELHDGPLQDLSLGLMHIDDVVARSEACQVGPLGNSACNRDLLSIRDSLERSLSELRSISSGLGVPGLADRTLPLTLTRAVHDHQRRTGTTVDVKLDGIPDEISLPAKITLYRLVQEALNNAFRHAGGVGQALHARREETDLVVEVRDRGPGFDVEKVHELMRDQGDHLGLLGMRERIESLGGSLFIDSKPGEGTRIVARLSLNARKDIDE